MLFGKKKEIKELKKKIADIEVQVQCQQKLLEKIINRNAKKDGCPLD